MKSAVGAVTASRDRSYEYARQRRRRAQAQGTYTCLWCGTAFHSCQGTVRWCSHRCRSAAHRGRKTIALISWSDSGQKPQHHYDAHFRYFASRAAALAAVPPHRTWTVIDLGAIPHTPHPSPAEYLYERFIEGDDPYTPCRCPKSGPWRRARPVAPLAGPAVPAVPPRPR